MMRVASLQRWQAVSSPHVWHVFTDYTHLTYGKRRSPFPHMKASPPLVQYSAFWREVALPEHGYFESASCGVTVLPCSDADGEALVAIGLVMAKCVLDEHPIGGGLCSAVFDYLTSPDSEAHLMPDMAGGLGLLSEFDPELAVGWASLKGMDARFLQVGNGSLLIFPSMR